MRCLVVGVKLGSCEVPQSLVFFCRTFSLCMSSRIQRKAPLTHYSGYPTQDLPMSLRHPELLAKRLALPPLAKAMV